MRRILFLTIAIGLMVFMLTHVACNHAERSSDVYISRLDSLIDHSDDIEHSKLLRIAELRQKRTQASSVTDRYMINSLLFDEFFKYNSDSALRYINANIDIAHIAGNEEWEIRSKIYKAELLTATGLLTQSKDIMDSIDPSRLSGDMLTDYYGRMIYLYSHLGNYTGGNANDYYVKERAYKDSIISIIQPDHAEYLWYRGWDIPGTDKPSTDVKEALKTKINSSALNTPQDAKDAYILAKLCEMDGERADFKKYMTLSAIADLKVLNADIASVEELAEIMFAEGDIDHAYKYIDYALNKAISYPNRVKAYGMTNTLDTINKAYQERNEKQRQTTRRYLILACILAAVLLGAICTIVVQNSRLRRQRHNLDTANKRLNNNVAELSQAQRQLNEVNEQLKQLNNDLKHKNDELYEANYVKEEYIGYIFNLCSSYISKLENLKKNIHIKAVTKKYREIEAETADLDMKDELKEFYQSFDSVFLHIYPNFVNDFNSLLQDDKKIIPREGELLNTELRIYALVRLGITDSVKIAEFLHCSAQTVYNNRFKVRNKAIIPKKEFAESVRTLGRFMDRTS